jgi:hypothetical protein
VSTTAFDKENLSFRYPSSWQMRVTAEGVSSGCGEGFWFATAQIGGDGIVGVSRCPSAFDWPPRGQSIRKAITDELIARNEGEIGAVTELGADQLKGTIGVMATVTLDPGEAQPFGLSGGAQGVIVRGATSSGVADPRRPDIYEVFCLSSLGDPAQVASGCDVILTSFTLE